MQMHSLLVIASASLLDATRSAPSKHPPDGALASDTTFVFLVLSEMWLERGQANARNG